MKNLTLLFKTGLVAILLIGFGQFASATTYTATTSGNWSNSVTWGGTAPGASISAADNIIISSGITVTLDEDVTLSNAGATLAVAGTLSGTSSLSLAGGTISGPGTISINTLAVGAGGIITSTGTITVNQFSNSSTLLSLLATVNVADTVSLNGGVLSLGLSGIANLGNNVTIVMAGGSITNGTGTLNLGGTYNLYYTDTVSSVGLEASLTGLQNVTVNLSSPANQLSLTGNLTVAGGVYVQQGSLTLGRNTLTVNGVITATGTGSITGSAASSIVLNGSNSNDTLTFAIGGQGINNLTVNTGLNGSVTLASDVNINGALSLNSGTLSLNGNDITIGGTVNASGSGNISGNSSSSITVNGSGNVGTLTLNGSLNTLGNLTLNIGSGGSISLGSALSVSGILALNNSSLNLNGQNLAIGGSISNTGSGSITGNVNSDIVFNGSGSAGTLILTTGNQSINNLTINISSSGNVNLGSALTVGGALTFSSGTITIDTNNLTVAGSGSISAGPTTAYVITNGTGSLIMTVPNAGDSAIFEVGTQAGFAPVMVTNNSSASGTFSVNAQQGVYTNGTTGADLSATQSIVNTSWNVESTISSGANVNLQMTWNSSMQVNGFDNTQAYISHYTNGAWNTQTPVAATADGGGYYSLSLNGVTSFSPFAVFDKNTETAVADIKPSTEIQVFPNPSTDLINLSVPATLAYYHIVIYDALGNVVTTREGQNGINTFNVSNYAPGIYFLSLNNSITKRFIKQ